MGGTGSDCRVRAVVDLRSDTVTRPTQEMRSAMADAEVGDDAYGEDPTVRRLEEAYAELVGKEAGVFVPSGTMANQAALRVLGRPGTTVLCGRSSHVASFEGAAAGVNAGAQLVTLADDGGLLDPADVAFHVEAAAHHWATPSLVCIENTAMTAGGVPWPIERVRAVADVGLPVHMDGARLLNAVVATGTSARDYAAPATTVWTALSKGLCAPVGSVIASTSAIVDELRVARHHLGGQMRQAGVLAAAGLVGLGMIDRLADDHERAARLAEAVAERWPRTLDPATVRTNIVRFAHPDPAALLAHLAQNDVLAGTVAPGVIRLVTHRDVDDDGIDVARAAIASTP
jgi:threonine aldolase